MLHSIFSYFIARGDGADDKRLGYLSWFVLQYPAGEFQRDEAIFYDFACYCQQLAVPLKQAYLDIYLSTELNIFLAKSKTKIDGTENLSYDDPNSFETAASITREALSTEYRELEAGDINIDDFPVMVDKFRQERLDLRTTEVLERTYADISSSKDPGGSAIKARERITEIIDIYSPDALLEIQSAANSEAAMTPVVDTGILAIDRDLTALARTQLLDISAPPGAGKTRMAIGVFCHRALLNNKNVLYFTLEQSKTEIEAMLIARHVLYLFNDIISDKMITSGTVPKELQPKVEAARLDILESGKYGNFNVQETDLYLETFLDKIRTQDRVSGPYDLIVIDHMSLMQSIPPKGQRQLQDYQVVAKSYRKFKQYVRHNRKAGLSVNQFNREGIEAAKQDKEIDATMGAGGIEAYRSTDANITITYTATMAAQGLRRISLPKSRSSEGFGSIMVQTRLGCCYFQQVVKSKM